MYRVYSNNITYLLPPLAEKDQSNSEDDLYHIIIGSSFFKLQLSLRYHEIVVHDYNNNSMTCYLEFCDFIFMHSLTYYSWIL